MEDTLSLQASKDTHKNINAQNGYSQKVLVVLDFSKFASEVTR
jgi:hypothetical protein